MSDPDRQPVKIGQPLARMDAMDLLRSVLDAVYEEITVTDADGKILYISRDLAALYGTQPEYATGRHIGEVVPSTGLLRVLDTGEPEIGVPFEVAGHRMVVNRVPILDSQGLIRGSIGCVLFRDVSALRALQLKIEKLDKEVSYVRAKLEEEVTHREGSHGWRARYTFGDIVGESRPLERAKAMARSAARFNSTILLLGESGTGKELFAQAIHNAGARHGGPFVYLDCTSIPRELLESELFGYEGGSFTGALRGGKTGKFEQANRGTLFLDEIGDMPLEMQGKLLRTIEEREFVRIGGSRPIRVDFRLIAATNQNLAELVQRRRFRQDLYSRLNVVPIALPPLRDQRSAIPHLVRHFVQRIARTHNRSPLFLTEDAIAFLESLPWPGNVRELRNCIERLYLEFGDKPKVGAPDLRAVLCDDGATDRTPCALATAVSDVELQLLRRALEAAGGVKSRAAHTLGIPRSLLYRKLEKYRDQLPERLH